MSVSLHNLKITKKAKKSKKRVGRGNASGSGNYSGRGQKGQKSRSGASGFRRKGLGNLLRNVPKFKGQKRRYPKKEVVNISRLQQVFQDGDVVNAKKLFDKKLINTVSRGVKILGRGDVTKKLTVIANDFSKTAKEAIEKAGGKVIKKN